MNNTKIFITGPHNIDKISIAKKINSIDDDLSIAKRFTNDSKYDNINDEYIYYMSTQDIDLTYKNNFILFSTMDYYLSTGITLDSYYNDDIFVMSLEEFNNISDIIFKSELYDIIVIWIDSTFNKENEFAHKDMVESRYMQERLSSNKNIKYLYFFNETDEKIIDVILEYINTDEIEVRNELLIENS